MTPRNRSKKGEYNKMGWKKREEKLILPGVHEKRKPTPLFCFLVLFSAGGGGDRGGSGRGGRAGGGG